MKKIMVFKTLLLTSLIAPAALQVQASAADGFKIPAADANGRIGALMPYTRYDSEEAVLGGDAVLKTSPKADRMNIASQASDRSYVALPSSGAYAEWTMSTSGNGVTMRFTMPDTSDGMGQRGSLDIYVNGEKERTVDLTSYYMWQYFNNGGASDTYNGGAPCFAFDEVHFLLTRSLKPGDKIRVQSTGAYGLEYGVDFLEIEPVPDEIEQPANSVSVSDYGAVADDGQDDLQAFKAAVADADKRNMDLYIPAGTYHLSGMWNIYCKDIKITGAGIWYTNLQFTSDKAFGGGISGGNGSNGGTDNYCKNVEFCNMYINSNLRSRYNENAVYKCFMDNWEDGSVIHDIWEEHFECGFWFGDYNKTMGYCDGVKVVSCRIRNNLADGVNFCQGTSNAVVYNCSVRNNGDDGLAMWNNNAMNAKDEKNNIFAYNTIELGWRAGGIAIYGGDGHKVHNNYLRDMFMASGIHLNTTFPGYMFDNTTSISFDNNILVGCGTNADCWNEDLSGIDIKQNVKNVTFNNTQIYDSPFTAIRIFSGPENIVFNNTQILGSGLTGEDITYSSSAYTACAMRLQTAATFNNLKIGNVHEDMKGNNSTWPIWTDNNQSLLDNISYEYLDDVNYTVPDFPEADTSQGGGIDNPLDGITGYNVAVEGLAWENEKGSSDIEEGDKVKFTAVISNEHVDIPEGVAITLKVLIDGKSPLTNTAYKGGLKAGQMIKLSPASDWIATAGGHTIDVTVNYNGKLPDETTDADNSITRLFNVKGNPKKEPTFTKVTGGYDLHVIDITYENLTSKSERIDVGDKLVFSALVVNRGDKPVPSGTKLGVQFQLDEKYYGKGFITWNDQYYDGLGAYTTVKLTATGGGDGEEGDENYFFAPEGTHTITAWVDDTNLFKDEIDEDNNKTTITLNIPYGGIQYFDNVDSPDNLDTIMSGSTGIDNVYTDKKACGPWYTITGIKLGNKPTTKGIYIQNGKKVVIR